MPVRRVDYGLHCNEMTTFVRKVRLRPLFFFRENAIFPVSFFSVQRHSGPDDLSEEGDTWARSRIRTGPSLSLRSIDVNSTSNFQRLLSTSMLRWFIAPATRLRWLTPSHPTLIVCEISIFCLTTGPKNYPVPQRRRTLCRRLHRRDTRPSGA